jgi:hypothetical protein
MVRIDTYSTVLLASQREVELRRELHLKRLVREAQTAPRSVGRNPAAAVPVMRAWLRTVIGDRPTVA